MGINENVQEEYLDREETMVKDRTWADNIRFNAAHQEYIESAARE